MRSTTPITLAATTRFETVLRLDTAFGLLIHEPPSDATARDALASALLQHVAGLEDVCIARRPSGRPRLALPHPELGVSLSRRDQFLMVGFSPSSAVGVDIEIDARANPLDPTRLASDHFTRYEAKLIASQPPTKARDQFLRFWVAKEAVLKATGRGVFDGMHEPDLASSAAALQTGDMVTTFIGKHRASIRVGAVQVGEGRSAYCALALIRPAD